MRHLRAACGGLRLIGASLRATSTARPADDVDEGELTVLTDSLLMRVRAERAQSFASRLREMVADSRLSWPAIGATASVLCVAAASSVLRASTIQEPDSLAAMISALGSPGSESRPLRPADNGISFPRLSEHDGMRASGTMEQIPEDDVIYAFRTVIGRDGSLSDTELLSATTRRCRSPCGARVAAQEMALLNAVNKTRFVPAQTLLGHAVVDMVILAAKTTVAAPDSLRSRPAPVETRAKEIRNRQRRNPPLRRSAAGGAAGLIDGLIRPAR